MPCVVARAEFRHAAPFPIAGEDDGNQRSPIRSRSTPALRPQEHVESSHARRHGDTTWLSVAWKHRIRKHPFLEHCELPQLPRTKNSVVIAMIAGPCFHTVVVVHEPMPARRLRGLPAPQGLGLHQQLVVPLQRGTRAAHVALRKHVCACRPSSGLTPHIPDISKLA